MLSRLFSRQPPTAAMSEAATQQQLAQSRRWQGRLRWLAWTVPVILSIAAYVYVSELLAPEQSVVALRQATNIIFISTVAALVLGIFIYQIQIILARQVATSAELERKVQERTQHLTEVLTQLDEQNKDLVALDKQKSEFVTLVSHELRGPLTNINGGLELLLNRDRDLSPRTRETLNLVSAEAERLTHFVETILSISTLESGHLPVVLGPVDVTATLRHVLGQFSNKPPDRLIANFEANLPLVLADEPYLQSVLFHLVDNAFKYAPDSHIWVNAYQHEGGVMIKVKDQGPGIPPEAANRLFGKFERLEAKDSQNVYGYGLGLYMCKLIMEALRGEIRLSPDTPAETVFEVELKGWSEPLEESPEISPKTESASLPVT